MTNNKRKYLKKHVGGELISDLIIPSDVFLSKENIKEFIKNFYKTFKKKINVEKEIFYEFPNGGITYLAVLSESHFGIHTYPEINFISFNVYFCSIDKKLFKEIDNYIINWFKPVHQNTKIIKRGVPNAKKRT